MAVISRGFKRRHEPGRELPPGQYLTMDFPVLSAGPTPRVSLDEWTFTVTTEVGEERRWTWDEFLALPKQDLSADIHCVTSWSKLGTTWQGVSVDELLGGVGTSATAAMAHCYGGYTTNLPLADLTGGKAWVVHAFDGKPLPAEHGGPARLLVPHLYFWKSAKWVRGLQLMEADQPGFWESLGYNMYGDPWKEQRYQGQ